MRLTQIRRFPERLLSTVQRGTAFEYRALALLTKHLSMSLTRVGGSYDGGVDLIGWWWVPSTNRTTHPLDATIEPMGCNIANRRRLRVLAQCKAEKRKMGPAYLRELEGVVYRHASSATTSGVPHLHPSEFALRSDGDPTPTTTTATTTPVKAKEPQSQSQSLPLPPPIALLVSESAFTRNCLLAAHASPLPFLLVHLPPSPSTSSSGGGGGAIGAVFGNPALVSANGVLGGELEIRWEHGSGGVPSSSPGVVVGGSGRPRLWWQGQPLPSWTPDVDANSVVLNQR